jgi:conserved hypothetical protein, YceG family
MTKKRLIIRFIVLIPVVLAAAGLAVLIFQTRPLTQKHNEREEQIAVPSGMRTRALADLLEQKRLIRSSELFYLAARYPLLGKIAGCGPLTLESGMFRIKSSMSTADIFALVSSGKQAYVRVSVPEGLTVSKIAQRLEKAGICSADDFKAAARNKALIAKYNIQGESLEGYLFPDTYFFTPGLAAGDAADIMVSNFFNHAEQIPALASLSAEEFKRTIILASIVEREYRVDSEAPLIASVFINRIKKHIGLYSCATIEYIITEIQGQPHPDVITYKDLKINSPYNTYKWAALPPGPISNPGMVALTAAAEPARTDYYYFRLIDPETGRHAFSTDFNEHIKEGTLYHTKK